MNRLRNRGALLVVIAVLVWGTLGARGTVVSPAPPSTGDVYAMTNTTGLNQIWAFGRGSNGTLAFLGAFETNGAGSGGNLNSQGALALKNGVLFAVDAGSNEVSSFTVTSTGLTLVSKVASGGITPVSVTAAKRSGGPTLVYVLNAGGMPNIMGFTVGATGVLKPLANSGRMLSSTSAKPYKISFDARGTLLVVTESGTNNIDTYTVGKSGLTTGTHMKSSNGPQPSGFAFDPLGHLIVAEALNSAASSYSISAAVLTLISGSVADGGQGACCIAATQKSASNFAYAADTGSSTVAGYALGADGSLTLLSGSTPTGGTPVDVVVSGDNNFVYVLDGSLGRVVGFQIQADGSLTQVTEMNGLPSSAYGLAGN